MLDTTTDLRSLLNDPDLLETRAYLAGEWTEGTGGRTFEVTNPARGDVIAKVADIDREQAAGVIDKAYDAQKEWAALTGKDRAVVLRKWYDLMVQHADDPRALLQLDGNHFGASVQSVDGFSIGTSWFSYTRLADGSAASNEAVTSVLARATAESCNVFMVRSPLRGNKRGL